jgi:hypothetical protein
VRQDLQPQGWKKGQKKTFFIYIPVNARQSNTIKTKVSSKNS